MFKLVVLLSVISACIAAPQPGILHGSAPVAVHSYSAIPTAISHQSRVDVHNTPILQTYSVAAAPLIAAPAIHSLALPATAVSHSSRVDLHRTALVHAPVLAGHGYGLGYGAHLPALHGW